MRAAEWKACAERAEAALEKQQGLWWEMRMAVGEAYGELDKFDLDPVGFVRSAYKNERAEFWGRKKAEAALAAEKLKRRIAQDRLSYHNKEELIAFPVWDKPTEEEK